jgi:hypothetical protein
MRKLTLFAILAVLLATAPAFAQTPVNQYVSSDDGGIVLLIKYYPGVSTNTSATVASTSTSDLTFQVASAAYTGFECPVSGALGGIIDVTNAACNTLGEVVDIINATAENFATGFFRAVIVDGLRSDSSAALLTAGATQATRSDGLPIYSDTSANFAVGETRALVPIQCRDDISCWVTPQGKLIENPFGGTRTKLTWFEGKSTYGSGTSVLNVYSVKMGQKAAGTSTTTTLWSEAMGATTVNKQFTQFQYVPIYGLPNEKLVVRITNSAAQASVVMLAAGLQEPVHNP